MGLFVAELVGNGKTSRAVIKKGSLTVINRFTVAGILMYILDHNKKICKGGRTGFYFEDKFYESDRNGRILMPYGLNDKTEPIILVHNEFAQLTNFTRPTENYSFSA